VHSRRWWVSGVLLGLAAGVKLTPAVAGLYFAGARRWKVVALSPVVFVSTVALSIAVGGAQARFYFTDLLGDAARVGEVDKPTNQSLRGVVAILTGEDVGYGPLLLGAVVVTAVLGVLAWRRIGADDPLGRLVVVMLFGLLVSPISWTHHWVWVLPLVMWLVLGSLRERTRILGWAWMALVYLGPPWLVVLADESGWITGRHWYTAVAGSLYVLAAVATLAYVAFVSRRSRLSDQPSQRPCR
jgi:alpha-1,2-mannosyltransferase